MTSKSNRSAIHPDFLRHLEKKDQALIDLYTDLRGLMLDLHPDSNEMLYHTTRTH